MNLTHGCMSSTSAPSAHIDISSLECHPTLPSHISQQGCGGVTARALHMTAGRSLQRGDKRKVTIFWPFCTFWTRVAITAPRRPKRTKPGSKAVWVLGNQPVAGFARRFGLLARQHVRCGAHMCPFQGQKSALGARSYTRAQPRFTANIRAQTML